MPTLLTNFGAAAYLRTVYKLESPVSGGNVTAFFLESDPMMDRTKVTLSDWPFSTAHTDPGRQPLAPSETVGPEIVGGRAVLQWGPPAYQFTCLDSWECYGLVFVTDTDDVIWVDRWPTPRKFSTGDIFQIIPSVTMTSECPPLGGCT